jgi:hypothetical protein
MFSTSVEAHIPSPESASGTQISLCCASDWEYWVQFNQEFYQSKERLFLQQNKEIAKLANLAQNHPVSKFRKGNIM